MYNIIVLYILIVLSIKYLTMHVTLDFTYWIFRIWYDQGNVYSYIRIILLITFIDYLRGTRHCCNNFERVDLLIYQLLVCVCIL